MLFATITDLGDTPLIATAVHNGHDLRPEVGKLMSLDEATRLREEDPYTDVFADRFGIHVIAHRSRFEVDLNRPREEAVYETPDDAWGLELWSEELSESVVKDSLELHDVFYQNLRLILDQAVQKHGGFILYDIHSYNHMRNGPDGQPAGQEDNPDVNLGTGSLPEKWRPVADVFLDTISKFSVGRIPDDARENVKFKGREVAAWVHENYGEVGCALAIEFKKTFMDEWTGVVVTDIQEQLAQALVATEAPALFAWKACLGRR